MSTQWKDFSVKDAWSRLVGLLLGYPVQESCSTLKNKIKENATLRESAMAYTQGLQRHAHK